MGFHSEGVRGGRCLCSSSFGAGRTHWFRRCCPAPSSLVGAAVQTEEGWCCRIQGNAHSAPPPLQLAEMKPTLARAFVTPSLSQIRFHKASGGLNRKRPLTQGEQSLLAFFPSATEDASSSSFPGSSIILLKQQNASFLIPFLVPHV